MQAENDYKVKWTMNYIERSHLCIFDSPKITVLCFLIQIAILVQTAACLSMNNPSNLLSSVRVELFFKNDQELQQRLSLLSKKGVRKFNLVNKSNDDEVAQWIQTIQKKNPESDICAHYSMKYNKSRKKDGAFSLFNDFLNDVAEERRQLAKETLENSNCEVLLLTGSGKKGKTDSVNTLQRLERSGNDSIIVPTMDDSEKSEGFDTSSIGLAVAFNPFFPSKKDHEEEQERLEKKISTEQISKVYLQFGTDLRKLRAALQWLQKLQKDYYPFSICGSIFLPTKKLIAQQKFRPWNGVFLSETFLESEKSARIIVLDMMRLYEEFQCEILIEAPGVRTENDVNLVENLLLDRDASKTKKNVNMKKTKPLRSENGAIEKNLNSKKRKLEEFIAKPTLPKEMLDKPSIVLFGGHDIRTHDNLALQFASFHKHVTPVFIWSRKEQGQWGIRGATEVVLKDALGKLSVKLKDYDSKLILRSAHETHEELEMICREIGASAVYYNKEHTPESRERYEKCKNILGAIGVRFVECQSSLLYDPAKLSLSAGFNGGHWGTLMPFLKSCQKQLGQPRRPMSSDQVETILKKMKAPPKWPSSRTLEELDIAVIKGRDRWDLPILKRFPMSEENAQSNLSSFFSKGFYEYETDRSRADIEWSTSMLSVHLRIGTLSPNVLYYKAEDSNLNYEERKTFSRRLFWRDLSYFHLLYFPLMRNKSIRTHYDQTEWITGEEETLRFEAWKKGQTGYPLVDAGMRELYKTGWLIQSVRMICASFLTEYLRINWVKGAEWFHYTLVDADSAINPMMWQNAGRSGIDQWNFVMSPVAGSQDNTGTYTKKWVPELAKLARSHLFKPWEAPADTLFHAGVELGTSYPYPIVSDLKLERQASVENVLKMRRNNQQFNNDKGYDLISLPNGEKTVVFTKKEYRIDRTGSVVKFPVKKSSSSGRGRRRLR